MPTSTVLEITQDILSDMSSDKVNTISETAESLRVAAIIKSTYYKLIAERQKWPHLRNIGQLTALSDTAHPSHMRIPTGINRIEWIKYDKRVLATDPIRFLDVEYKHPDEFIELLNLRDSTAPNIQSVTDFNGVTLLIRNDIAPTYWTSFDDEYIVFDSYNSALDSTLQQSKTQCLTYREPTWGPTVQGHTVSTAYAVNDIISKPDTVSGHIYYYLCTVAGTTDAVAPAYSTVPGAIQVDGTAQFLVLGLTAMDGFTPDLPAHLFPRFISECKAQCFNKLKQVVDSQEERDAKRQRIGSQFLTYREDGEIRRRTYGRK